METSTDKHMTLRPFTTTSGEQIQIGGITAADIPTTWEKKAVLARPYERFCFFSTPDGQVAEVRFHQMNGWDDLFCRIGSREFMLGEYNELIEGERFETRTSIGNGAIDYRSGRMVKARRVA